MLVRAPEGYEEFQKSRETTYYRKPDPTRSDNYRFGGGMIRLGETIEMSSEFAKPGNLYESGKLYPFKFLYLEAADGHRIVHPYSEANGSDNWRSNIDRTTETNKYMVEHPMPRGIYRFKFEHPCQPGAEFYINIDVNNIDYSSPLTELIQPVVDYYSCDAVKIYPFADGRMDYAVGETGRPRNLVFRVTGIPNVKYKDFYFFPYDSKKNPVDHRNFHIDLKKNEFTNPNPKITLQYYYLEPDHQWIRYNAGSSRVDSVGVEQYLEYGVKARGDVDFYKIPGRKYDPKNDLDDWGRDGVDRPWQERAYSPEVSVDVPIDATRVTPSYSRPSYVGYRCSTDKGYMEFKLINIPNRTGTVILKDGAKIVKNTDIAKLSDLVVRWNLDAESGSVLKNEYTLELTTSPCPGAQDTPTQKFTVKLIDISEGVEVVLTPRRGACPGDRVTLTATNLGIPEESYQWTIKDSYGRTFKLKGRTVNFEVSAPIVEGDRFTGYTASYNTYDLTVIGTRCGDSLTTKGTIPVSPEELWWMPRSEVVSDGYLLLSSYPQQSTRSTTKTVIPDDYNWNNPDNWTFLRNSNFYAAKAVPTRCTNVHILNSTELGITDSSGTPICPQPDLSKEGTPRDLYGEPYCVDITFHSGSYVSNIDKLNYQRAMVRQNFGVAPSYKSDRRSTYNKSVFDTDPYVYERGNLYLMSAPLYDIYAGDYSFSASPYTYQLGFKAVPTGSNVVAEFAANFNEPSPLQSVSMAHNNNSIGLIVAKDDQGFNRKGYSERLITQLHGILELPYFDRSRIARYFYHHTYDASKGESRFQYFDGKAKRFRRYYSYAKRSKMAYRFIFETPTTQRIAKLPSGEEGYTMEVTASAAGQEMMVGNPFMSPIKIEPFLRANKDILEPYVRVLESATVQSYEPKLQLDGAFALHPLGVESVDQHIDPLEAFVVKLKEGVGPKTKIFFPTKIQDSYPGRPKSTSSIRSASSNAPEASVRYLALTLQSLLGKDRALIAYDYDSSSIDKLLMSTKSQYPSIAIIAPADRHHTDLYADATATGHYQLATRVAEPVDATLSLSGSVMGGVTKARLIDHKKGLEHDLTGGKSCQIKLYPDDGEDRLELRINGDFTTVAPLPEPDAELQAQYSEGRLTVRTTEEMSSLRLVKGDGITVYTQSLPGLTEYSEQVFFSSGSYIVEVVGTDGISHQVKLVVR